jgi:hypothetical protein
MPRGKEFAQLPKSPGAGDDKASMNRDTLTNYIGNVQTDPSNEKKVRKS